MHISVCMSELGDGYGFFGGGGSALVLAHCFYRVAAFASGGLAQL